MLGSPLLRALLALAVLLLLLLPMWSLTSARAPAEAAPAAADPASSARLELASSRSPFAFSVSHLGKVIWQGQSAGPSVAKDLQLPLPKEGVDLLLRVEWTGRELSAARLALTAEGRAPVERTVWGERVAEDVVTFSTP